MNGTATSPSARARANAWKRDLQKALNRLPETDRKVIQLAALDGLSHEETAQELGVAIGTVKSRLFRARERFRSSIEMASEPQHIAA